MGATISVMLARSTPSEVVDRALTALSAAGASEMELFDAADPIAIAALFPLDDAAGARARAEEELRSADVGVLSIDARPSETLDQGSTTALGLRPFAIGRLAIMLAPIASAAEVPEAATSSLVIQPEGAFGSGLHATTALCLERLVELAPVPAILDVGTGTGILALAALVTGTREAFATDQDPRALAVARANADRNGLGERIRFSGDAPDALGARFPRIVANIPAAPLIDLARPMVRAVAPGGLILLSGVREDQADEVSAAYRRLGLAAITTGEQDGWVRIELIPSW
jgi:ribosomal protein L11 methylase PrmA